MIVEVERKQFVVNWSGSVGTGALVIIEMLKKKEFMGVLPKDGDEWFVGVLRRLKETVNWGESIVAGTNGSSWRNHQVVARVTVAENRFGIFFKLAVESVSGRRKTLLCFPSGRNGDGWGRVVVALLLALGSPAPPQAILSAGVLGLSTGRGEHRWREA